MPHPIRTTPPIPVLLSLLLPLLLSSTPSLALYDASTPHVVQLTAATFDSLVLNSADTWLVEFYAPWCGHCRNLAPTWSSAATKLNPYVRVAAVDCDAHPSVAQKFGVRGYPTIKLFRGDPAARDRANPEDYNGDRSTKAIVDFAKSRMVSFAARVKARGMEAYFADESALPHVLLFSDKTTTAPLFKALSAKYHKRVALGEIHKSDLDKNPTIAKQFNVKTYPTLLAFPAGFSSAEDASRLDGDMTPEGIEEFIASYAVPAESDAAGAEKKPKERVYAQPKAHGTEIDPVESSEDLERKCLARTDGLSCCLLVLPGGGTHELFPSLKPVAEKYKYDKFAFVMVDSATDGGQALAKALEIDETRGGFGILRGTKRRMGRLEITDDDPLSDERVAMFVDKALGGDVRYQFLPDELPQWTAPPTPAQEEPAEEPAAESATPTQTEETESSTDTADAAVQEKLDIPEGDDDDGQCAAPADGDDEGTCAGP